jgi:hypothetical protein
MRRLDDFTARDSRLGVKTQSASTLGDFAKVVGSRIIALSPARANLI